MYFIFSALEFRSMPLGHSGLLILWDPAEQRPFGFKTWVINYHAAGEINAIKEKTYPKDKTFSITMGHYKLNSLRNELLEEDTLYEITITEMSHNGNPLK